MSTNSNKNYQPTNPFYYNYPNDVEFEISDDDFHEVSISRVHTDEELETVVKELLHNSKKVDAKDITVTVQESNVNLSGTVQSQEQRDYAINVVKLIHGVGEVHSDLVVKLNPGILPTDIGRD
jgi:osmotically-inducible protein OsmY